MRLYIHVRTLDEEAFTGFRIVTTLSPAAILEDLDLELVSFVCISVGHPGSVFQEQVRLTDLD